MNSEFPLSPSGRWEPRDKSFIKVRRRMMHPQHPLHPKERGESACAGYAWLDMVARAEYTRNGELLRGQLSGAQSFLAERWNWSEDRVRRFLKKLESEEVGMIARKRRGGRRPTVISIRHYGYYNGNDLV